MDCPRTRVSAVSRSLKVTELPCDVVGGAAGTGAAQWRLEAKFCHTAEGRSNAAVAGGQAVHESLLGPHSLLRLW